MRVLLSIALCARVSGFGYHVVTDDDTARPTPLVCSPLGGLAASDPECPSSAAGIESCATYGLASGTLCFFEEGDPCATYTECVVDPLRRRRLQEGRLFIAKVDGDPFTAEPSAAPVDATADPTPEPTVAPTVTPDVFNRVATFPICKFVEDACDTDDVVNAEIVDVSADGATAVFSSSEGNFVGFVDLTDPADPQPLSMEATGFKPSYVAFAPAPGRPGDHALAPINKSPNKVNVSGELLVFDARGELVRGLDLGCQPDAVAVSPDGNWAVIACENERDEDLGGEDLGEPPQMPPGSVKVVDISDPDYNNWAAPSEVDVTGLSECNFPTDPEPESVSINALNEAVVTLQENNCIVVVDVAAKTVTHHFSAGEVSLDQVDTIEDSRINQVDSLSAPREPDGVAWIDDDHFITADEGDLDAGGRGFTIFHKDGTIVYTSGNWLEHHAASMGHYPEKRSENKGTEPEGVGVGVFGGVTYAFVLAERAGFVAVFDLTDLTAPTLLQTLPCGESPEGVKAVPQRDMLVVASEGDYRGDGIRSSLSIYLWGPGPPQYPTIASEDRADGTPIPFGALSGLAAAAEGPVAYVVEDDFYKSSRILTLDLSEVPARLTAELRIVDTDNVLATMPLIQGPPPNTTDIDNGFDAGDRDDLVNDDGTVNLDPKGIDILDEEHFVVAHEGKGTIGDEDEPIESPSVLVTVEMATGVVKQVIMLPEDVNDIQRRYGFAGVAVHDGKAYVAFQRAWGAEPHPRIGIYDFDLDEWAFVYYRLDDPESPDGGWVGLADIASLDGGAFLVLERDNKGGPDARVKRIYKIDFSIDDGAVPKASPPFDTLDKLDGEDIIPKLEAPGGAVYEKVSGIAVVPRETGDLYVVNNNDGVDDNSGETQLLNLGAPP